VKINSATTPALSVFLLIYTLGSFVNFFITPNPYAALHSGKVALDSLVHSANFVIQKNIITIFCIFLAYIYTSRKKIVISLLPVLFIFFSTLSGFVSGVIFNRPMTYLYDGIVFLMVAAIAKNDIAHFFSNENLQKIFTSALFIFALSVILALLRPNIWGYLPFQFSRESRGEVTLAAMTGALIITPCLIFSMNKISFLNRILLFIPILIIVASTATRSVLVSTMIPLILFSMFRLNSGRRIFYVILIILLLFIIYTFIGDIFILEKSNSTVLEATLTGRADLWSYYWFKFIKAPFLGHGSFLLERALNYTGEAFSEIGLLKTAAENGIFAAALQLFAVLFACVSAVRSLRNKYSSSIELFTSLLVLAITPNFILQDHSRILNSTDFIYWYSVFFHIYLFISISRFSKLSRTDKFRHKHDQYLFGRLV